MRRESLSQCVNAPRHRAAALGLMTPALTPDTRHPLRQTCCAGIAAKAAITCSLPIRFGDAPTKRSAFRVVPTYNLA